MPCSFVGSGYFSLPGSMRVHHVLLWARAFETPVTLHIVKETH